MITLILLILALICFLGVAFSIDSPRINLTGAGLSLCVIAALVRLL